MTPEDIPRGLGIYCGRVASVGSAFSTGRLIERLQRAGARYVGLCVEALDGWRPTREQLEPVVRRIVSAGIRVHLYALPSRERALLGRVVADDMLELAEGLPISGLQIDAEESYRGLFEQLRIVVEVLVDGVTEAVTVVITAYGLPSEGAPIPWDALAGRCSIIWQAYLRSAKASRVRAGILELRVLWGDRAVIVAVASYPRKAKAPAGELNDGAARLTADLRRACLDQQGRCDVPGAWVWSEGSLDGREIDALAAWVAEVGWR